MSAETNLMNQTVEMPKKKFVATKNILGATRTKDLVRSPNRSEISHYKQSVDKQSKQSRKTHTISSFNEVVSSVRTNKAVHPLDNNEYMDFSSFMKEHKGTVPVSQRLKLN